jgi:hypothetical protein
MPTIPEETLHELVWVSFEVPACEQLKHPVPPTTTTSADVDSCNAYMIMSGEPVIYEETEEDLKWENFQVVPLTRNTGLLLCLSLLKQWLWAWLCGPLWTAHLHHNRFSQQQCL